MRSLQMALPLGDEPAPGPCLYLACPLTSVDGEAAKLIDAWCTHVINAVSETAAESAQRWQVAVHAPVLWSNPARGDAREPEAIYTLNSRKVRDCAGMIVLSVGGGSTGMGQELAWAVALRLPVLYVHPGDEAASRQILGTPGDVTVAPFSDATSLIEAVRSFLRLHRATIEDHARRATGEAMKFAPLRALLVDAWDRCSESRRLGVQAEARVHQGRIAELLDNDRALGLASLSELTALSAALDVPLASLGPVEHLPDLGQREHEALAQVSDEYDWSGSKALQVERAARMELARGGVRRLTFQTPDDWLHFDRRLSGHA